MRSIVYGIFPRRSGIAVSLGLWLAVISLTVRPAQAEEMRMVATLGARTARGVAVQEQTAFLVSANMLEVFDISQPQSARKLGELRFKGVGYHIIPAGDYAYLAARMAGIHVIDISDPANPALVATYDTIEQATGLARNGNLLFCANRTFGVEVIDISDRVNPVYLGSVKTKEAQGLAARDNILYVGEHYNKGLTTIDVSVPSAPRILGTATLAGNAWGVALKGDYAYVATGHGGHGVAVVDISNPEKPTLVRHVATKNSDRRAPDCWEVSISGDTLFLADGDNGLFAYDISDPASPRQIAAVTGLGYAHDVAPGAGLVLVADYDHGLRIIAAEGLADGAYVETGRQPEIIRSRMAGVFREGAVVRYIPEGQVRGFAFCGEYVLLACGRSGLEVMPLATPESGPIARLELPGTAMSVACRGDRAYIGLGSEGLGVADVSDPLHPKLLDILCQTDFVSDLYLAGELLVFRTDPWNAFKVADVSDTGNIVVSKNPAKPGHFFYQAAEASWGGGYVSIANGRSTQVYRITREGDRDIPLECVFTAEERSSGVCAEGDFLYVAGAHDRKFRIYSMSEPSAPRLFDTQELPVSRTVFTARSGEGVLLFTTAEGALVYSLADPAKPSYLREMMIPGKTGENIYGTLALQNGYFWAAMGRAGFWIIPDNSK